MKGNAHVVVCVFVNLYQSLGAAVFVAFGCIHRYDIVSDDIKCAFEHPKGGIIRCPTIRESTACFMDLILVVKANGLIKLDLHMAVQSPLTLTAR